MIIAPRVLCAVIAVRKAGVAVMCSIMGRRHAQTTVHSLSHCPAVKYKVILFNLLPIAGVKS